MRRTVKKLAKEDNFLSLAGNLIIAFLGFAGFALLARSYKPDVFGEWVIFISSGSFIEMFRFGITNTAIIRYISGANEEDRLQFIGANWVIGLIATILICLTLVICNLLFHDSIQHAGYGLFFSWYPILAFINLPYNTALVILQADQKFDKMLWIKTIYSGGFFVVLVLNYIYLNLSLTQLAWANIAVNFVASAICLIWGMDGFSYIAKATRQKIKTLLDFGKYTTFTLIGTNLLRSADTLIISLSPLGTAAVALYSIPIKLTEIQQIPLRSFAATAFPKMSKASIHGKIDEIKKLFYTYSGAMTYLFIFVSLFTFLFADLFVLVLGGKQYLGIDPITGFNTALIVRIFSIYGLLLPVDRMTGIGLDAINCPDKNAIKVFIMVLFNVIGDLIAVFIFKSLALVAVGSICFTIIGVWVGYYFLDKQLSLSFSKIFSEGINFYSEIQAKIRRN
jgi:Membrane protein involved in the export of O-antigen and teichoic acid